MCDMPVSCMICLKAIQGLGGGPICFLLLLIHTLNILFYEFDSNARINFLTFKCHTQKNGTDLRRSPHNMIEEVLLKIQLHFGCF